MKTVALFAVLLFGLTACEPREAPQRTEEWFLVLADCEDTSTAPCFTYDEGSWRVVHSYNPYSFTDVPLCQTRENRRTQLPCLSKAYDRNGNTVRRYWDN